MFSPANSLAFAIRSIRAVNTANVGDLGNTGSLILPANPGTGNIITRINTVFTNTNTINWTNLGTAIGNVLSISWPNLATSISNILSISWPNLATSIANILSLSWPDLGSSVSKILALLNISGAKIIRLCTMLNDLDGAVKTNIMRVLKSVTDKWLVP